VCPCSLAIVHFYSFALLLSLFIAVNLEGFEQCRSGHAHPTSTQRTWRRERELTAPRL
jgi:hypothetical protein